MAKTLEHFKCDHLREGKIGTAELVRFEIEKEKSKFENLRMLFAGHGAREVIPGTYIKLRIDGTLWMSDTHAEIKDHLTPIHQIERRGGHILIGGLGIGLVVKAALECDNVLSVTVIENNPDVIQLVAPQYDDPRLTVIEADLMTWKPPKDARYSVVYLDIWPELCTDNLKVYGNLKRRFSRCSDFRWCWGEETLRYEKRRDSRRGWY